MMKIYKTEIANIQKDRTRCFYCDCIIVYTTNQKIAKRATIEHIIPKSRCGNNLPVNKLLVCSDCNFSRGRQLLETFISTAKKEVIRDRIFQLIEYVKIKGLSLFEGDFNLKHIQAKDKLISGKNVMVSNQPFHKKERYLKPFGDTPIYDLLSCGFYPGKPKQVNFHED